MKFNYILLFYLTLLSLIANCQDTLKVQTKTERCYSKKFSIKISSQFFFGEVPIGVEYRLNEFISNIVYLSSVYINPVKGGGDFPFSWDGLFCKGYKTKYEVRLYFPIDRAKRFWFYLSPNISYKNVWQYKLNHIDWGYGPGSETRLEYNYDLSKKVLGSQLLLGFTFPLPHGAFEFYLGGGIRYIILTREFNWFQSYNNYWGTFSQRNPPKSRTDHYSKPSVQIGFNYSLPIGLKKNKDFN